MNLNYLFHFSVPDDYNRVVLDTIPDMPDSDYVNASYVDVSKFYTIQLKSEFGFFILIKNCVINWVIFQ